MPSLSSRGEKAAGGRRARRAGWMAMLARAVHGTLQYLPPQQPPSIEGMPFLAVAGQRSSWALDHS